MELTREVLKTRLETDAVWLDKCAEFLLEKTADGKGPDGLNDEQLMDIQYWGGWAKAKRALTGDHKKKAISMFTEAKMLEWLFDQIVAKYAAGNVAKK